MLLKSERTSKMVRIDEIQVVPALQRQILDARVVEIVNNFDKKCLGRILCNYRDGKYYIIDGQHRLTALARLGYKEIECDVYFDLTPEEEAKIYRFLASTKPHTPFEKFKADILMKNKKAIELYNLVKSVGFKMAARKGGRNIACVNDLYNCSSLDEEMLIRVLALFRDTFDLKAGITGVELKGMFLFLKKAYTNKKFNYKFFVSRLESKTQTQLLRAGSVQKEASYTTPAKGYALALLILYNHNKSEANRLSMDLLS